MFSLILQQTQVILLTGSGTVCVWVGQKPLTDLTTSTSDQFWLYETHTEWLLHNGETEDIFPLISNGDMYTQNHFWQGGKDSRTD